MKEREPRKPGLARIGRVLVAEGRPLGAPVMVERILCQGPRRDGTALVVTQNYGQLLGRGVKERTIVTRAL